MDTKQEIIDHRRRLFRERHGKPDGEWERFYEYLIVDTLMSAQLVRHWEENALFSVIQQTFDGSGSGKCVLVSPYLVHNLAVCVNIVLRYDKDQNIDWHEHDDVFKRTCTGFIKSIIAAIQKGELVNTNEGGYIGGLKIPDWFIKWALTCAAKQS